MEDPLEKFTKIQCSFSHNHDGNGKKAPFGDKPVIFYQDVWVDFSGKFFGLESHTQTLNGMVYFPIHEWVVLGVNVGKYTIYIEHRCDIFGIFYLY